MASADPITLLVVGPDADTPALIKSLLRGRIAQPFVVEHREQAAAAAGGPAHDVFFLECDIRPETAEAEIAARVRAVVTGGGPPPLVLLGGNRRQSIETALLAVGAADVVWKEELSAPLLDSQIRHALEARRHAHLQRQLQEAQKLETVGRLAGGVAHDFNNLLTAIVGFASLVAEQVKGEAAAEHNVAEILQAADRASVVTRQLLAFGRRQVLHPVRLQLGETLQGVTSLIGRLIGDDIDLAVHCPHDLPPVRGDRAQIEAVLLNLVMHARDAMPHGGRLTIETAAERLDEEYCEAHLEVAPGEYVRLAVSDTGDGLPADAQQRIFEPFAHPGHGRPLDGGLGLAAVYGIVKQSGGHILVHSERGVGTTFKLYLPVDTGTVAVADDPAAPREPRAGGTILLVEDADGIRRLAGEVIRRAGYRVLEAADPAAAVALAAAHDGTIDLLLTDIMMPGGNGVELAGRLTAARPRLNVLFMSGYTDAAIVRSGRLAAEAAFIQKPFTPQQLLRRVRQVLEIGV